jgi:hypothetical protein
MTTALDALNAARAAWEKTQPQLILDYPDPVVLNAAPVSHAVLPRGRCIEHAEPSSCRGPDAHRLTAASAARTRTTEGPSSGASACSPDRQEEA